MKYLLTLAIGAGLGYFIAREVLEREYETRTKEEIEEAKAFYQDLYSKEADIQATYSKSDVEMMEKYFFEKTGRKPLKEADLNRISDNMVRPLQPSEKMDTAVEALLGYQGKTPESDSVESDVKGFLLNEEGTDAVPFIVEPKPKNYNVRKPTAIKSVPGPSGKTTSSIATPAPYHISDDDFTEGKPGYVQSITLVYYAGDNTLVGKLHNEILTSEWAQKAVGDPRKLVFGGKSGDPDTAYVRCEQLHVDFEILREPGKASERFDRTTDSGDGG